MSGGVTFRFDADDHVYSDARGVIPHITGMMTAEGWIDDTWYTEEGSERGTAVHGLTAQYDLGALDPQRCVSVYRPYLLGHVSVASRMRATWRSVEVPMVHPKIRFGGRPDRVGIAFKLRTVLEVKTGAPPTAKSLEARAHGIQTALQAILDAGNGGLLPPEHYQRLVEYLKPNGRFKLEECPDKRDFDEAYRILAKHAA